MEKNLTAVNEDKFLSLDDAIALYQGTEGMEVIKELLVKGVSTTDVHGYTPFMYACEYGHMEIMKSLIGAGADVNAKNKTGNTSLMVATRRNEVETLKLLISLQAKINAKNNDGETVLMQASSEGRMEAVSLLIDAGADVNAKDYRDTTTLRWASKHKDIAKLLKSAGAKY